MLGLLRSATLALLIGLFGSLGACSSSSAAGSDGAAAGASASAPVGCSSSDGDVYVPGMTKPGAAGRFEFALVSSSPSPPALNDNTFLVQVTDANGNIRSGDLSVALDMPEHGHPSPKQPEITLDPASGTFTLEPMRLFMVGLWRITFSFVATDDESQAGTDSAVFEFCVD